MLTATLNAFWPALPKTDSAPQPPRKYRGPIFIGDAVMPWGRETLLLALLREDANAAEDADQL
ncbi:MAG: hypothetical protein AAGF27_12005 [Pseudomonadota bacterium]